MSFLLLLLLLLLLGLLPDLQVRCDEERPSKNHEKLVGALPLTKRKIVGELKGEK